MTMHELNTAWRTWCQAHPTEAAQARQTIRAAQAVSWQAGQQAVLAAYLTHLGLPRADIEHAGR